MMADFRSGTAPCPAFSGQRCKVPLGAIIVRGLKVQGIKHAKKKWRDVLPFPQEQYKGGALDLQGSGLKSHYCKASCDWIASSLI